MFLEGCRRGLFVPEQWTAAAVLVGWRMTKNACSEAVVSESLPRGAAADERALGPALDRHRGWRLMHQLLGGA